jgi:hypothetical protein
MVCWHDGVTHQDMKRTLNPPPLNPTSIAQMGLWLAHHAGRGMAFEQPVAQHAKPAATTPPTTLYLAVLLDSCMH